LWYINTNIQATITDTQSAVAGANRVVASSHESANQQMDVTSEISKNIEAIHNNSESVTSSLALVRQKAGNAASGSLELNRAVSGFSL
jgi:methyl-accepting chemotaxis protein